jgi:hypothetical protein
MKSLVRETGVPAEIPTEDLPNTSLERYLYVNPSCLYSTYDTPSKTKYV